MALPTKGDPRRPLHLAIRSTRMLAIVFLLFGSISLIPLLMTGVMKRGGVMFFYAAAIGLMYVGPGVAYLVFSIYLKARKFWAVVAALVLASIQLVLTLIGAASTAYSMRAHLSESAPRILIGVAGLLILALAQLVYHLCLSFEAIKHAPLEEQHGFEPLMIQPIIPPATLASEPNLPPPQ